MKRILAIILISVGIFANAEKKRPNIIYIMTDDHSYQTYGAYATDLKGIVKTPNLDRIANEGMRFDKCYVTNSLCGPARATVLTGKHTHMNGFYANSPDQVFDGTQTTFPKVLQKAGYETALIGKWHLMSHPTGFNFWEILTGQGDYYNPKFIKMDGKVHVRKGYNSDIIGDMALDWIKNKRSKDKPFMIMVHFKGVHSEWEPALRHANMYDNVKFPIPETFWDDYSTRGFAAHHQEMTIQNHMAPWRTRLDCPPKTASKEEQSKWQKLFEKKDAAFYAGNPDEKELTLRRHQRYMQNYCATLFGVDENVGRILNYLKESGLDEDTVVMYASDQGFYMGEHGWYDKRFMYEESFRTPFTVRWPNKIKAGSHSKALVQNLDFAETILDIAGCPIPQEMQGLSLKEILLNEGKKPDNWRKSLYYHYYEWPSIHMVMRHDGIITDSNEKLIDFYPVNEKEYYDLNSDKHEVKNRIKDPTVQDRIKILQRQLESLRTLYLVPKEDKWQNKQYKEGLEILKLPTKERDEKLIQVKR